jgi:hypothetical protein
MVYSDTDTPILRVCPQIQGAGTNRPKFNKSEHKTNTTRLNACVCNSS